MEQIAPVILILVGLLFVAIGFFLSLRAKAAAKWPTAPGIMLKSELAERTTKTRTNDHQIRTYTSYEPVVEYQYTVNGEVLTGKRLAFGLTRLPLEKAQEYLNKFPGVAKDEEKDTAKEKNAGRKGFFTRLFSHGKSREEEARTKEESEEKKAGMALS